MVMVEKEEEARKEKKLLQLHWQQIITLKTKTKNRINYKYLFFPIASYSIRKQKNKNIHYWKGKNHIYWEIRFTEEYSLSLLL